jgi:Na+/proline symporter
MATFYSAFTMLGAPGMVYREGIAFTLFSLNVPFGGLCVYLLGSRIWRLGRAFGYITPGDMLADYYGGRYLRSLVAVTGFLYVIPYLVIQIQAGGIVSAALLGENGFVAGAGMLTGVVTIYVMVGGMRSVAWTDAIQAAMLVMGMLAGGAAMLLTFGGPLSFGSQLLSELPDSSLTVPGNTNTWQWTMLFTVCLFATPGALISPPQWMRYYSANSSQTLQRGAVIFSVVLAPSMLLGVMLIGLAGQVIYPLDFSYRLEFRDGPVALRTDARQSWESRFEFVPRTTNDPKSTAAVSWRWSGRDRKPMTGEQAARLKKRSENANYRHAIDQLQRMHEPDPDGRLKRPLVAPHPQVGSDFNSILVVLLHEQLPAVFGAFGAVISSLILVAVMAAAMSTADSNLHALSAVITRDVYDQYVRPSAADWERLWVGRIVIVLASLLALLLVIAGHEREYLTRYDFIQMIAMLGLMALSFSSQLLPIVVDILFIRKGTSAGSSAGLVVGLLGVFVFGPLFSLAVEAIGSPWPLNATLEMISRLKTFPMHGSVWGLVFNIPVFVIVSRMTQAVPDQRRARFAAVLENS